MKEETSFAFKLGQTVESKYNTDGYRGAWFKSEIVKISSRNGGELWCALKYPDYPDEKLTWTKAYQFSPFLNKDSKQKNKELMLRPTFPPVVQRCNYDQNLYIGLTVAVVDDEWNVGDLVDWWKDDCFWECQITEILDKENVKVELPKRPIGEGNGSPYIAASGDLRPSLKWCPKNGWSILSKVNPHERSCVSLLTIQAEQSFAVETDPEPSIEPCLLGRKPIEKDEIAGTSHSGDSASDDVLDIWKSRSQKKKRMSISPEDHHGSSCNAESLQGQLESNKLQADIQMGLIDGNPRDCVKDIVKPTEPTIDLQTKRMLSRKIVQNAKCSFWVRRYALSTPYHTVVQQKLDHVQGDSKLHLKNTESYLEDPVVVHSVPFSVATPPLFYESRDRSGETSSCNGTARSSGSPGLDSDENNVKAGVVTNVGMKSLDREKCEGNQIGCKLQVDVKGDEYPGAISQSEVMNLENLQIALRFPEEALPFTTIEWEDHCDSQEGSQNLLQQENIQHQACILALPAFNGLQGRERAQWLKRIVRPLQKLPNNIESHSQNIKKSPVYWNNPRGNKFAYPYSASRAKGENLSPNYSLEARNLQSLKKKPFYSPFAVVRHEETRQDQQFKAACYGTVVCEEAMDEEMITILHALQEMSEKVIFMSDCLQLGMSRLFQKREKAAWSVTTNMQGPKQPS